jgi:hypothetical protein
MTTISLDPQPAGTPGPFVSIIAESFPVGVAKVTVLRTVGGREFKVRGLVNVSAAGTVSERDFEAPPDVVLSYRVQHFDVFGNFVSWSDPVTTTLAGDPRYAWFHNPLDPSTSIKVRMLAGAAGSLARPIDAEVLRIQGRSVGVALFGARRGVTGVVLDCLTESAEDAAKFDALFGGYDDASTVPIVCVRAPIAMRLPPTLFALVDQPLQQPLNNPHGGEDTRWVLRGDEIAPPPEAIISTLLGYDDFTAFYADYAAFTAAYTDYREAQLDYSIAGTA